jgi:chorismate mutase-like protein
MRFLTDSSRERSAVRMRKGLITRESAQNFSVSARRISVATSVVLALLSTSVCSAENALFAPRGDLAALDQLLQLMKQRLTLMHEVASWKWNANQPIAAPQRERELLDSVVRQGRAKGLEAKFVRRFFAAQIEAARAVEQADFDRWKGGKPKPPGGTKSLAELRRRIDELNRSLLDVLAELYPALFGDAVQKALPQRAEKFLSGNDLAPVRKTAIASLLR